MGQKNVVEVIKLIAKGTIEEKVVALQEEKKELISKIIEEGELGAGSTFNTLSGGRRVNGFIQSRLFRLIINYKIINLGDLRNAEL